MIQEHNQYSLKKTTIIYTILFAVLAIGVFFLFIYNDKTLLRFHFANKDSFSQRYMFIFEFKRFLTNLFANGTVNTWDWSIGLGSDGLAFNISNLFNPFSYLTVISPAKYVDVVFSFTVILRLYFSGLFFLFFARKVGLKEYQNTAGALLYAFSPWAIYAGLIQSTFLMAMIMLPLVLLGVEKIFRKESPVLFVISVGYTVLVSFFFSYIVGIITLLYYIVRYLTYYRTGNFREFMTCTLKFIGFGIVGLMISGLALVITVMKYSASTASTGKEIHLLLETVKLIRMPMKFTDWISVFGSNSLLGIAPICLIMIPVICLCAWKRRTNAVMALLLLIAAAFPVINSAFNFFSYPSGRWMFAISFFIALATAECFDKDLLRKRNIKISIVVFFCAYCAYVAWLLDILTPDEKTMVLLNLLTAAVLLVVIMITMTKDRAGLMQNAVLFITVLGLVAVYNISRNVIYGGYEGYLDIGEADKLMNSSPQHIGTKIKDNDFYRIDQVDEITGKRVPHSKMNEAMYFGNRTNYVFYSSVDAGWLEYNKLLGNNMGYYKRVAPNSNDNRFGLDLLSGTKYFIGSSKKHKKSSSYAGYGFEPYKIIDGTQLLKNRYDTGLGTAYYKYMKRSEWEKLSYADREIAMLKAVIVPDDNIPEKLEELKISDVKSGVKEIICDAEQMNDPKKLRITAKNDDKHAMIMSIQGVGSQFSGKIYAKANNKVIKKCVVIPRNNERAFSDVKDLTMYLGTGESASKDITLKLYAGTHHYPCNYDRIVLYQVPLETYDKTAQVLQANRIRTKSFKNDIYKGNVKCKKDSVVYFSILDDGGWDVYADGRKCKKIKDINIAFTGISLNAGEHDIELRYHSRGALGGLFITLAGIAILLIIVKKRRKALALSEQ